MQRRQAAADGAALGQRALAHRQGQAHLEHRAHAHRAVQLDAAAHELGQLARYGRAQARAAKAPRGRGIGLGEGVEDAVDQSAVDRAASNRPPSMPSPCMAWVMARDRRGAARARCCDSTRALAW